MIISNSRRFIFVHNYKTAGEAITAALSPHLRWTDIELGSTDHGKRLDPVYRQRFGLWKHSTAQEIRQVVGDEIWQSYLTFGVVRHPYDRAVSLYGYLGKMAQRKGWQRHLVRYSPTLRARAPWNWPMMRIYMASRSFPAFIRHPDFGAASGTEPQGRILCDGAGAGAPMVDHVLRFENLERDFAGLCERIGVGDVALPVRNAGAPRTPSPARPERGNGPDAADRAVLQDIYRRDFEIFGYAP